MTARWVPWDLIRTAFDFTARGGFLQPQDDIGPPLSGVTGDKVLPYTALVSAAAEHGIDVVDMRQEKRTGRGKARGTRKLSSCTALLWHQTASILSLEQALGVPAHAMIFDSTIVLLHPLRAYLYHANAANKFSIGVEINCRACGIEDDLHTLWRSKKEINGYESRGRKYPPKPAEVLVQEATDLQVVAGRLLGEYYVREVQRQALLERVAAGIVTSMYHRNSSSSRVSDPGSRIALGVGVAVAQRHSLTHGVPVVGDGKRTPTVWGGAPNEPYNWRVRGY